MTGDAAIVSCIIFFSHMNYDYSTQESISVTYAITIGSNVDTNWDATNLQKKKNTEHPVYPSPLIVSLSVIASLMRRHGATIRGGR